MANELVVRSDISTPYLINDNREKQVKVRLSIQPSDEIRSNLPTAPSEKVGTDVCIVLDVSGSMREVIAGETVQTGQKKVIDGKTYNIVTGGTSKLDAALAAIRKMVPLLREHDTLSLIAYEDSSHVIFKGLKISDKEQILKSLEQCRKFQGNTNISGAIREARETLRQFAATRPKKIIFLTDGYPVGDTEEDGIREGTYLSEYNISIDCLGIGKEFNLGFIEQVVAPTKGRTDVLHTSEDAERIFAQLLKKSQEVIATNLTLKLTFTQEVRVTEHFRGAPENLYLGKVQLPAGTRTYEMSLGQLERNQRYDYYFLVTVPALEGFQGAFRLMKAEVHYYIPSLQDQLLETSKNISVDFGSNVTHAQVRNGDVEKGYTLAEIKRLEREADEAHARSDQASAISRYEEIIEKYERLGMLQEITAFRQVLNHLRQTGNVSFDVLNEARRSSSKAAESGELTKTISTEEMGNIFGNRTRRKR